jgi:hypothetical protein
MSTLTLILISSLFIALIWAGNELNNWCDKNSNL